MQVLGIILALFIFIALIVLIIFLILSKRETKSQKPIIPLPTRTKIRYDLEYYMREFIQPYTLLVQNKVQQLELNNIDDDTKALRIYNFIITNFSYVESEEDFWRTPAETLSLGFGSDFDLSLLLASMLISSGISEDKVRVVIGKVYGNIESGKLVVDTKKRTRIVHCWVGYLSQDNKWRLLEPISKEPISELPQVDDMYNLGYYLPEYMFNNYQGWEVES
jgi:hypothetical protein